MVKQLLYLGLLWKIAGFGAARTIAIVPAHALSMKTSRVATCGPSYEFALI